MKIKQRPEDFSVIEGYRFEPDREGEHFVYRMDKQKLSTLQAVERLRERFHVRRRDVSFCGLKDKQGRTEQLIAIKGRRVDLQEPDIRLTYLGRSREPLSARNITSNRFSVIVRDLSQAECERVPESVAEVTRVGVVNYFDSQRFGFMKHGQGFVMKDLLRGDFEAALEGLIARPSPLDRTDDAKVKKWFSEHWGEWDRTPPIRSWVRYRAIIERLREKPRDFGYALLAVDRRMRAMIVYELQSALWNDSVRRYLQAILPYEELLPLRYQLGTLLFPRSTPGGLGRDLASRSFPLLAPDSTFSDPVVEASCRAALSREKLTLEGLVVPRLLAFHFKHEERPLLVFPDKLRVSEPQPDELNRGRFKVVLSFTLPPGAYASLVVRRVMWFATDEHVESQRPPRRPRVAAEPKALASATPAVDAADTAASKDPGTEAVQAQVPATPKRPSSGGSSAAKRAKGKRDQKGFLQRQREKKAARAERRGEQEK